VNDLEPTTTIRPVLSHRQCINLAKRLRDEIRKDGADMALVEALRFTLLSAGYSPDAVRLLMVGKPKHGILVEPGT